MGAIPSQITSLTIVYSTVYSDADQRKDHSSASLAFVWGIHRGPVNSPHKWPVTRKNVSIWWRHHVRMRHIGAVKFSRKTRRMFCHTFERASPNSPSVSGELSRISSQPCSSLLPKRKRLSSASKTDQYSRSTAGRSPLSCFDNVSTGIV